MTNPSGAAAPRRAALGAGLFALGAAAPAARAQGAAPAGHVEAGGHGPQLGLSMALERVSTPLLRETLKKLTWLARKRSSVTPDILLCEAVEEMNVRSILRQRGGRVAERALANLDLFLEMARPYDVRGLKAFSDAMRAQWEEARRTQQEGRPDADQFSVSLVTMHSAKGLEWGVVIPVNTAGKTKDHVRVAYDRRANLLHLAVFGCHAAGCEEALERKRREQRFERQRLWYVAATRARDLLLMPRFAGKVDSQSWSKLVGFDLDALEPFEANFAPANIQTEEDAENRQDRATFEREADAIRAATPKIRRDTPHLSEGDPPPDATVLVAEDAATAELHPVKGGLGRGLILHKLLEEVLTGETEDAPEALAARGGVLSDQLGLTGEGRPDPAEMARAVRRGLERVEIAAIRAKLKAEWPIASTALAGGEELVVLGVADAVAVEADGSASCVVDWKSDVAPEDATIAGYKAQVGKYLEASGAADGLLVFLTSGDVHRVKR
jgi:exodeoxyribonuclease-5